MMGTENEYCIVIKEDGRLRNRCLNGNSVEWRQEPQVQRFKGPAWCSQMFVSQRG